MPKCTIVTTQDDLPDGDTAIQYTNDDAANLATALSQSTITEQAGDPSSGAMTTGQLIAATGSGDIFYKSATGLYTLTGAYAAD